ncbi:baseplate tail-tube junction protein [Vibrio parahaemolyticus]|nr:baseplate tail-tube junction protein [Vibrio parahaemolyticus]
MATINLMSVEELNSQDANYASGLSSDKTQITAAFPSSVADHKSYLIFRAVDVSNVGLQTVSNLANTRNNFIVNPDVLPTIASICLYMPALTEQLSHNYSASGSDTIANLAQIATSAIKDVSSLGSSQGADTSGAMAVVAKSGIDFANTAAKAALKNNPAFINAAQKKGYVFDRNAVLFGGTEQRQQTFLFNLRAKNPEELREIAKIVHLFRRLSCATRTSVTAALNDLMKESGFTQDMIDAESSVNEVLQCPPIWFIEERINKNEQHRLGRSVDRFVMGGCGITNVRVNKAPDNIYQGIMQTANDPVSIELEITFRELVAADQLQFALMRGTSLIGVN